MGNALARLACLVASPVLVAAGGATWALITQQLKEQKITVPASADQFAGRQVVGPITAYAQAAVIEKHSLAMASGRTFAELGEDVQQAKASGDTELAERLTRTRETVMQGNLLRASLFTSVLAYGVAALTMGLGVLTGLLGSALPRD